VSASYVPSLHPFAVVNAFTGRSRAAGSTGHPAFRLDGPASYHTHFDSPGRIAFPHSHAGPQSWNGTVERILCNASGRSSLASVTLPHRQNARCLPIFAEVAHLMTFSPQSVA
jgi:hypothetical protein